MRVNIFKYFTFITRLGLSSRSAHRSRFNCPQKLVVMNDEISMISSRLINFDKVFFGALRKILSNRISYSETSETNLDGSLVKLFSQASR